MPIELAVLLHIRKKIKRRVNYVWNCNGCYANEASSKLDNLVVIYNLQLHKMIIPNWVEEARLYD